MTDYKLPATYPDYDGAIRSGNFGPNSGRYAAYVQFGETMMQLKDYRTGQTTWPTRAQASNAARSRTPRHVAIVGLPNTGR